MTTGEKRLTTPVARTEPVLTLTGNLLAERTLTFERWLPGKTQRAVGESFQVGGKGINVIKMLARLGVPGTALCFTGGAPGAECEEWLRRSGLAFRAFPCRSTTRSGTVVRDASGSHPETTFLGPDVPPDAVAVEACAEFLDQQPPGRILALCGSIPGWRSSGFDPLRRSLGRWSAKGRLVVDTYGPALVDLAQRPLALLKINADELRSLGAIGLESLPPAIERVIVTDGPRPVRIRDTDGGIATFDPPAVREVSATGSGDVLMACVLEAMFVRERPLTEAVDFVMPYAAANAADAGIAEFPLPARS